MNMNERMVRVETKLRIIIAIILAKAGVDYFPVVSAALG